jgi:predicted ATPase
MIRRISIENFKSLKKADIKVSNLNLLMGVNGMGKSSFMQVLLLLRQSDKLGDGVIDLNGTLAQIGQGKDALYQFAEEESIVFELAFDEPPLFSWKFPCQSDKENLTTETDSLQGDMELFKRQMKQLQYVCAERIGPRDIYDASTTVVSDKKQLGLFGELAVHYINVFGFDRLVPESLRKSTNLSSSGGLLIHQLAAWMQDISPGVSIRTNYIPEANKVVLGYQFDLITQKTDSFRPKNVGFGISYVLPIVLALLTAEDGKIIVIENPESHIHPRGQAELGKLIALAANTGAQIFVETHSDHILNGIRVSVKEQCIDKSKVNILYFDKVTTDSEQYTQITPIRVDKNGELSDYPKDLLDEWTNQLLKLI